MTGAYARSNKMKRQRDLQVTYYVRRLAKLAPWIELQDRMLVRRFAQLELLIDRVYAAIRDSDNILLPDGGAKRLVHDFRKLVQAQASIGAQLGLSPVSRRMVRDSGSLETIDISDERARRAIDVSSSEGDDDA